MIRFLTVLLILFLPTLPAAAQDTQGQSALEIEEHITGLDIENHFKHIEELYTGKAPDMNAIQAFIEQYPLDDFVLSGTATSNRGSQEPVAFSKTKIQFIEEEKERDYDLIDTRIRHTLTDIKYLDDKLSAEVSYTSLYQGRMKKIIPRKGLSFLDFKSLSICTTTLKLVDGTIKGKNANCKTDIIYGEPISAH
tara:strand:- start:3124 stop:3705 length:582 start_codon:yes stop_codon:yes gene_type:complete